MPSAKHYLCREELDHALSVPDLTEPGPQPHALALLVERLLGGLVEAGWPAASVQHGPRIVSALENFGRLGIAGRQLAAEQKQAFWLSDEALLRTHTTSLIGPALQAAAAARRPGETIMIAVPGMTFRRDVRDRWHCAHPHQMDLWVLGEPSLSNRRALLQLVADVLALTVPDRAWTQRERPHAYTEGGAEVLVMNRDRRVEVLECGCIARSLLQRLDIDPALHGGLCLGMGLDRLLMLHKGINDIRLLRDPRPVVQAQMHDLSPWRPLAWPHPIVRDLSVALKPGQSDQVLSERLLRAAGTRADWVEAIEIVGRWPLDELPSTAIERLGMSPDQENVVIRVVLRDCVAALDAEACATLLAQLHVALHEGTPGGGYRIGERLAQRSL